MSVSNQFEAEREINRILRKALAGKKSGRKKRIDVAKNIAKVIFLRWRVGPFGWRQKHLLWYLDVHIGQYSGWSQYEHWLAIRSVLNITERAHLVVFLANRGNANYTSPSAPVATTLEITPDISSSHK